jgi:hypothetical protein
VDAGALHGGTDFGALFIASGVEGGSCDFLVCKCHLFSSGAAGPASEVVTTSIVGNGTPQISKRSRAGGRQTAHLGRSTFKLTREGEVLEQAARMLLG